jgi:aspartyl-tRNA(Asn)/glutamyl-tRNA(Gln) amidotransferase subunit B
MSATAWEPVIGLEIHVHLKTKTKMFCRCATGFGDPENTRTCPVCLAFPGTLPVANARAVEWTIKLGLALGCEIADRAVFHRKHYFYPDLSKGYQISQYDEPLCVRGRVVVPADGGDVVVGITRAHLEEDAAKTVHVGGGTGRKIGADRSLVDFNRGGTPLVEIVTEPDLRSADDARRFLQLLRQTIVELGISDAEMEKGTLRCDANVSVRPAGSDELRTRWELKNMNSFTFIGRGIEAAVRRQVEAYERGETVAQQTYDYDADTDRLTPHRSKEEAEDYRYMPEPDLVPLAPDPALVERLRGELRELPSARIRRLEQELGFESALGLVTSGRDGLFDKVVEVDAVLEPREVANVLMNQFAATGRDPDEVDAQELAKLLRARPTMTRASVEAALRVVGREPIDHLLAEEVIDSTDSLGPLVDEVLAANASEVEAYRSGKEGLLGYFVGQVMKQSQGKANAKVVNELIREKLKA